MVEFIGLEDFLLFSEAILGVPAHDLYRTSDIALAAAAVGAPDASIEGYEAHTTLAEKAAVMTHRLCVGKPLLFGNQRVAYVLLQEFLARNGCAWVEPAGDTENGDESAKVLWRISTGELSQPELTEWISRYIQESP